MVQLYVGDGTNIHIMCLNWSIKWMPGILMEHYQWGVILFSTPGANPIKQFQS